MPPYLLDGMMGIFGKCLPIHQPCHKIKDVIKLIKKNNFSHIFFVKYHKTHPNPTHKSL